MSVRTVRRGFFLLLGLYAVFLTYPGLIPFNRIRPLVFGLPFVMVWICLWIILVGVGVALLDAAETRAEAQAQRRTDAAKPFGAAGGPEAS